MIFVKKLSDRERRALGEALRKAKNTKWYRRLKIIELSSKGYLVSELSQMFGLSDVTVRNYIHRYNEGGLNALQYRKSSGRPRKLDFLDGLWEITLQRSPSQFEKLKTNSRRWTLSLLVRFVECYYGENVCIQTIANAFKRESASLSSIKRSREQEFWD
jgi:transposase